MQAVIFFYTNIEPEVFIQTAVVSTCLSQHQGLNEMINPVKPVSLK